MTETAAVSDTGLSAPTAELAVTVAVFVKEALTLDRLHG